MEWLRYGLYNKERSTSVDASSDHADLYSLIHSIFKGTPVRSYEQHTVFKRDCAVGRKIKRTATSCSAIACD